MLKPRQVHIVKIESLQVAEYNPSDRVEAEKLKALMASIEKVGLIYPILITPKNEIVDGHRRATSYRMLGYDEIPALVVSGDRDALYAEVNANANRLNGNDQLCVYLKQPNAVQPSTRRQMQKIEEAIGRPLLQRIAKTGGSVYMYRHARAIARYCERIDDPMFIKKAVEWIIGHRMSRQVQSLVGGGVDQSELVSAIMRNKALVLKAEK